MNPTLLIGRLEMHAYIKKDIVVSSPFNRNFSGSAFCDDPPAGHLTAALTKEKEVIVMEKQTNADKLKHSEVIFYPSLSQLSVHGFFGQSEPVDRHHQFYSQGARR